MNIIEANVATPDAGAITIARFNNFINDSLLEGAIDALKRIGQVKDENIPHYLRFLVPMSCRWRRVHWLKPVNTTR